MYVMYAKIIKQPHISNMSITLNLISKMAVGNEFQ